MTTQKNRGCNHTHLDGRPCGATAMRGVGFCKWHVPQRAEAFARVRMLEDLLRQHGIEPPPRDGEKKGATQ